MEFCKRASPPLRVRHDASQAVLKCAAHAHCRRRHSDVNGCHELEQRRGPLCDGGGAHAGAGRDAQAGGEADADAGPRQTSAA